MNADKSVLILPPPDGGGRGWLPSPGLPEPDSTPSFGHPIHTDDTTKRHTPDLQLFGAWSVDYMSTMARNLIKTFTLVRLSNFSFLQAFNFCAKIEDFAISLPNIMKRVVVLK